VNIASTPNSGFQTRSSLAGVGFSDGYILHADRLACPVCGHSTGDCTGDEDAPRRILGWGEESPNGMKQAQMIYLEEDVWEERQITPGRMTKILKHRAGSSIPYEEAKSLGLI